MEFQKDTKVYSSGECITQHKQLAFDFEISKKRVPRESLYSRERYGNYMKTM